MRNRKTYLEEIDEMELKRWNWREEKTEKKKRNGGRDRIEDHLNLLIISE